LTPEPVEILPETDLVGEIGSIHNHDAILNDNKTDEDRDADKIKVIQEENFFVNGDELTQKIVVESTSEALTNRPVESSTERNQPQQSNDIDDNEDEIVQEIKITLGKFTKRKCFNVDLI